MTIPPFGDNISNITDANTFRVWFDATNSLIQKINPLEVYGITAGVGEVAGITLDINRATGAAVIGLDLPLHITGPHKFGGGISFENEVRFKGLTVDAHGATFFGNLVRSFNGQTGDITAALTGIGLPGGIQNGDILVYSPNGSTLVAYSLFAGGTFDNNNTFRFGGSGGMLLGTGGVSYGFMNHQKGNVQIFGVTGAQISLHDASFDPTSEPESGAHMFFGRIGRGNNDPMGFVYTGGKTSGFESNSNAPYVVIQHSDRKIGLLGITNPSSPIDYKSRNQTSVKDLDVRFTDSGGVTSGIRVYQNGFVKTNEGIFTETSPKDKGLRTKKSIRILGNQQNVAVDLDHTSDNAKSNFTVFGQESSGASLSPVINARNTGDVVIGGLTASDGGSDFGSLNVASGKFLVGGTLGDQSGNGVQVLSSSGISTAYKIIFPNQIPFSADTITEADYKSRFGSGGTMGVSGLDHLCVGGDAMVTNKMVTQPLFGTDLGHFVRISHDEGVTYAPVYAKINYNDSAGRKDDCNTVGDDSGSGVHGRCGTNDGTVEDYRTGLDRLTCAIGGNPYDRIITFKDDDGNNLVGDFDIEVQFPSGFRYESNWNALLRDVMGVAVFVAFTDDDLHGLTLGVKNVFNNLPTEDNGPSQRPHDSAPFKFPTDGNGLTRFTHEPLDNVANPRANLAPRRPEDSELHSRILFCYPHSLYGELDPCGNNMSGAKQGGFIDNYAAGSDRRFGAKFPTFTLSGTCLRRLQILPFMTKAQSDAFTDSNNYDYDGGDEYDPYFPVNVGYPDSQADNTPSRYSAFGDFFVRGQGFVKASFTQVEVD